MITIQGYFADLNDNYVNVLIEKQSEESATYSINEEGCGIYFAGDEPVSIIQDVENEFQHILSKQCTINLICEDYMGDLFFADNARDVTVTVIKYVNTGHSMQRFTMFYGYLEPVTFSQGFAHKLESFTLTANDVLGTLEYLTYKDITLSTYAEAKQNATNVSFQEMLFDILDGANLIWYDQSKGVESSRVASVFSDLGIFESYLLGETYDDLWTKQAVLDEIMRYLNLHILQEGSEFYIFDWDTMMGEGSSYWINLKNGRTKLHQGELIQLEKENYAGSDTNVTVAEVYNQIQVTDELESIETVIESPLDSDSLKSFYDGITHYMTEFWALGEGEGARVPWVNIVRGSAVADSNVHQVEWYIQPMYNVNWKLNTSTGDINDQVSFDENGRGQYPYLVPLYTRQNEITPLIMKCGSVEKKDATDDSPISSIDMDSYLFISINGNNTDPADTIQPYPDENILQLRSPIMEYISTQSGGVYSPSDSESTNYIVFSGKLLLQPKCYESDHYLNVKNWIASGHPDTKSDKGYSTIYDSDIPGDWHTERTGNIWPVPTDEHKDGKWYTRRFYKNQYPGQKTDVIMSDYDECLETAIAAWPDIPEEEIRKDQVYDYSYNNLQLWVSDTTPKSLNYKYSATGNGNDNQRDRISKLPILECELIIGNKRLVEYDMDEWGHSKFKWVDINEGVDQSYTDENGVEQTYSKQTFSLGINPKTSDDGDYIIGQEFDLQNTVDYTMNIDGEGTAIPITSADALSGKVDFKILGPINLTYDQITRRHPSFWRHTKWTSASKSVLSHLESIIIKDFEAKIYSSGSADDFGDNDLIYVSDETDRYISKNDDTTFKFITQLSKAESIEKGISPSVNQNAVVDMTSNLPLRSIYNANTATTAKPEEHYVDQYYRIFSTPKITMETTLHDNDINFEYQYESNGINKESYVLGISRNLKMNTVTVKLKSIE